MKNENLVKPFIEHIGLLNFRGFKKESSARFAPLTFLVGPNSSGKSSLISAFLFVTQSNFLNFREFQPEWSGRLIDLGSFKDTIFDHRVNRSIKINIRIPYALSKVPYLGIRDSAWNRKIDCEFTLLQNRMNIFGYLRRIVLTDVTSGEKLAIELNPRARNKVSISIAQITKTFGLSDFERSSRQDLPLDYLMGKSIRDAFKRRKTFYRGKKGGIKRLLNVVRNSSWLRFMIDCQRVSSGREGPKRFYPISDLRSRVHFGNIDPTLLDRVEPSTLSIDILKSEYLGYRNESLMKIQKELASSLNKILKKLDIAESIKETKISAYQSSIDVIDSQSQVESNLMDIGYGASQIIPVIRGCLSRIIGPLYVEQPEIHLHPKAQGIVAELLASTSKQRQVIVETHSVHMINRVRILIAQGDLPAEHVLINYVSRDSNGSHVKELRLNSNGEFIDKWPDGFFEERYQDALKLTQLQSKIVK